MGEESIEGQLKTQETFNADHVNVLIKNRDWQLTAWVQVLFLSSSSSDIGQITYQSVPRFSHL